MIIKFPDGSEKEMVRISSCKSLMTEKKYKTFHTYVCIGKLPSVKYGTGRYVEMCVVNKYLEDKQSVQSTECVLKGYS